MGERMEEMERVEEEERMGQRVEEEERVGESGEGQQKVENVEEGKTVEQKEVMEKKEEVKDDQEMEDDKELEDEDKEMEKPVINSLLRPESSNSSFGETSTAMEGQEFMDQFLENPEAKQKCFPEAMSEFLPPFSGLIHLSLAKNKIVDDEELLAVCLFPALRKLTIYKNPITLSTGTKPHLVISMLRDRLGIDLITHEPRPQDRTPVFKVFNPKRKVNTHIPKVPRQPLMLETAKQLLGLDSAGPGETQSGEAEPRTAGKAGDTCTELMAVSQEDCREKGSIPESITRTPERQHQEPVEGFFMTQVDDITLNSEAEVGPGKKQTTEPSVTTDLPEKYRGYEELLGAATDPYFVEPVGIQQNVQQLEWYLRKLQPYPDPFGHVNLQQRCYIPKQRKVQKLPESTSHKSKADKMEEILKRMKEQRAMMVVPLAHVLRGKGVTRQEYDEAVALLRDLQLKYVELRGRLAANVNRLYEQCKDLRSERPEQDTLSASSSRMDF
ncbi:X-ray radiation resistance-associated protein 1-like isoform X2 [Hypanus sabinus]|uniref:X-ray radiation resistance-associated protein 1-like isoform X2 n=1 Tax=Hypanus sabinus TaxID=79690 RepID=UPI0028C4E433|nr:X-ray radiation resistance-associated protein 1-like isoform X2 [Hypanus sabinus]